MTPKDEPLVVLLHSLASDASIWAGVQRELHGHVDAIAVDLPGHGPMAGLGERFDFDLAAARVADSVQPYGPRRPVVVGLSLGGMVAQRFAIDHPDRCAGLMVMGSNFLDTPVAQRSLSAERAARVAREGMATIGPELAARWLGARLLATAPETYRRYERVICDTASATMVSAFEAIAESSYDGPRPPFPWPVLVVVSDGDPATSHRAAQEFVNIQPGSQLRVIADAGHMSPLDQPHVVAGLVLGLVETVRSRRTAPDVVG